MAAQLFPDNPVVGQRFPDPAVPGVTQWEWDGQKWNIVAVFVRTNEQNAFNDYIWPLGDGAPGQQLETDGAGNLYWGNASDPAFLCPLTILGNFNGLQTVFTLAEPATSVPYTPVPSTNIEVFLGGVSQDPQTAYTITGSSIVFSNPPLAGTNFFAYSLCSGTGGGLGGGSVTFVGAGTGLEVVGGSAGIVTTGVLALKPATTLALGGVIPDGTTITISPTGVISSSSGAVGLGLSVVGGFTKVTIPTLPAPPGPGAGAAQAVPGSLYWDSTVGELFIYYFDGVSAQWISTTGSIPPPLAAGYGITVQSSALKPAVPALPAPPVVGTGASDATVGSMYYDTTLGALFYYYDDGVSTQWVQI